MGFDQWSALVILLITIVSSVVGAVLWITKKHAELVKEISKLRAEMINIERMWVDKVGGLAKEVQEKTTAGPDWLKPYLEAQQELLQNSIESSQTALAVAKQHGEEINLVRDILQEFTAKQEQLISLYKDCQKGD